jgi:hypothetical protein
MVPQVFVSLHFEGCFYIRVTSEEEAIFKAQQLDLIYAQYGMLYKFSLMHHDQIMILDKIPGLMLMKS